MPKLNLEKFNELVSCFEKLPGIGKKSAQKYAYHVALSDSFLGLKMAHCIENAVQFLRHCQNCGGIAEDEICEICADTDRNKELLCVVESPKDILTIENSGSYDGNYFVFDNANKLDKLRQIIVHNRVKELIFAFTPGINSDGIMLFIENELSNFDLNFTKIAQGVPTGVSLENVDLLSLAKAIKDRNKL